MSKNSPELLPHSAIAAKKITFSTHNTLCFFHKFYIRISVRRDGSATVFCEAKIKRYDDMAEREVYKYYSSDLLYALLMTEFTIRSECDFISKQKTDEFVASPQSYRQKAKVISLICFNHDCLDGKGR